MTSTILIVDHDASGLRNKSLTLRSTGYNVLEANCGKDALQNIAAHRPTLVILCTSFPDMSGVEVCKHIKSDPQSRQIPVLQIIASAATRPEASDKTDAMADAYLIEPFKAGELVGSIQLLLRARQAEDSLLLSEARYEALFHTPALGIWEEDLTAVVALLDQLEHDGIADLAAYADRDQAFLPRVLHATKVVAANEFVIELAEAQDLAEFAQEFPRLFIPETSQALLAKLQACYGNRASCTVETVLQSLHGRQITALVTSRFTRDRHDNTRAIITVQDITERKRLEQSLATADQNKDEFLAILAHELRNPLAPISHVVEVFQQLDVQNATIDYARAVLARQVSQLQRLVDDLLDISRITRGLISIRKTPVNVATIMARAVETTMPIIQGRTQALSVEVPSEPLWIDGDAVRLTQVIANLLDNAAKFSAAGGTILLEAKRVGEQVQIRVRDNGLGISSEMLPDIFNLFAQANKSLARETGGLGVGLTLVRELVELHGGHVEAHSAGLGTGTEITVSLPVRPASSQASPKPPQAQSPNAAKRVLLIDDNVDSVQSLALILRSWGHEVQTANDGLQGLAEAERFQPEAVILDIGMPGLDGYVVGSRLRAMLSTCLLIGLSGYGQDEDRQRALNSGFDHYLVKPAALDKLRGLLAPPKKLT